MCSVKNSELAALEELVYAHEYFLAHDPSLQNKSKKGKGIIVYFSSKHQRHNWHSKLLYINLSQL